MNDRLHQLALFARTVETGSFSKAGQEFGLSQPSVSRAIAALETRLGVKLLTRTTRQISTTDAGEALLIRAREAIAAIDDAEDAARGADRLSGLLRVALPTAFGVRRIIPLLPNLLAHHPQLRIDLMISDRYENLIAEGADLALRIREQADSSFVTRKLGSARRLFVASPSYLARRQAPTRLADLADHDLIAGPSNPGGGSWVARRGAATETQSVNPRIRTGSGAGLVACATAGLGIAISSIWMCGEDSPPARWSRFWASIASIQSPRSSCSPQAAAPRKRRASSAIISRERSQAWRTRKRREAASWNNSEATVE
jgi:DNA-binding transcriptional LysR family regulator